MSSSGTASPKRWLMGRRSKWALLASSDPTGQQVLPWQPAVLGHWGLWAAVKAICRAQDVYGGGVL